MDNQPSFDRGILIPIGVGVFSLIGICAILVFGRINASRATIEEVPTATAFQYSLIGTEPAVLTLTLDEFEQEELPALTPRVTVPTPQATSVIVLSTNTTAPSGPIITLPPLVNTNTPTRTPTSASVAPLNAGTYDDADNQIIYSGNWISQGVSGVYQDSLHVSNTLGNMITFTFIGQEVRLFYQSGSSLGNFTIKIDNNDAETLSQSSGSTTIVEWASKSFTSGTHAVIITHVSGGSINIDKIIVPQIFLTPTSTVTPTVTP